MDPDPNSVIDLDLDELVLTKEMTKAFGIIISDMCLLVTIAIQYCKNYFTLLGLLIFNVI